MCGIYGRLGTRQDDLDKRATASLRHRGPDDAGIWVDDAAEPAMILGHTRLSILDLSAAGHQPMLTPDERYALVFNGELYNFATLRRELEALGVAFRSQSDTEVVLQSLVQWGDAGLTRLEGMFAIALWDQRERRLLLARDPSGIKPLFWRQGPDALAFASEIKALLVDPQVSRQPNLPALAGFLQYLYVPTPQTAFQGIHSLRPGHRLVWQAGAHDIKRFSGFSLHSKAPLRPLEAASDDLERLLQLVIGEQMVADVPVGAFLSGGLDSGLIVALMAKAKRERGDREHLRTFTVAFGREGGQWDESARARRMAQHLGVEHAVVHVDPQAVAANFHMVADQFDEPFANPTAMAHDVLCQFARREVTVALAGDGGDEAFAGYPRHRAVWFLQAWQRLPATLRREIARMEARLPEQAEALPLLRQARRFVRSNRHGFADTYRDWLTFYSQEALWDLLTEPMRVALGDQLPDDLGNTLASLREVEGAHPIDAACYADIAGFLPDNVLRESDRISMRHALEVRVPFADRRVLQYGLSLPVELKLPAQSLLSRSGGAQAGKRVLRNLAARHLPHEVIAAPKQGFGAPMGAWLLGPLREQMERSTDPRRVAELGIVRPQVAEQLRREHLTGQRDRTWPLWSLMVLDSWFARWIERSGHV
ncbi:MAG: asparagine synthase (glutamine-hydrolyzing) [Deltaproteobacteria bacterium]|nr:asparagine synthase (glutamine-hydrolyzing) [Deltaproteobacteria bacterium]